MEVMGLMLGEFVDDYTVRVIDVFAMPQSGTVRANIVGYVLISPSLCSPGSQCGGSGSCLSGQDVGYVEADWAS